MAPAAQGKLELIERRGPQWRDRYDELT